MPIAHVPSEEMRLVARFGGFSWVHSLEMLPDDQDCTDMTDAEFEAAVCRTVGLFSFAPPL